jgi:hypothetical protein
MSLFVLAYATRERFARSIRLHRRNCSICACHVNPSLAAGTAQTRIALSLWHRPADSNSSKAGLRRRSISLACDETLGTTGRTTTGTLPRSKAERNPQLVRDETRSEKQIRQRSRSLHSKWRRTFDEVSNFSVGAAQAEKDREGLQEQRDRNRNEANAL